MSASKAIAGIPEELAAMLVEIGAHIREARKRRRETLEHLAMRAGINKNTMGDIEAGKPTVSFGAYASALWAMGLHHTLEKLGHPSEDSVGQALDAERQPERVHPGRRARVGF
jgi:transcriptional regulator with XRE-family HTH domain